MNHDDMIIIAELKKPRMVCDALWTLGKRHKNYIWGQPREIVWFDHARTVDLRNFLLFALNLLFHYDLKHAL